MICESLRRLQGIWSRILSDMVRIASYGACLLEKMFLRDVIVKSHQMVYFAGLSQPLLKVIENAFTRDLGGIIQLYMGYRLGVCGL